MTNMPTGNLLRIVSAKRKALSASDTQRFSCLYWTRTRQYTFYLRQSHGITETDAIIANGKEYKADDNGVIKIELSQEDVNRLKVTLIQNAGSGFDDVYNGYDIGFRKPDGEEYSKTYELTNGCGASIIMRKKDFDACGGFDEQFFMYYEDTGFVF